MAGTLSARPLLGAFYFHQRDARARVSREDFADGNLDFGLDRGIHHNRCDALVGRLDHFGAVERKHPRPGTCESKARRVPMPPAPPVTMATFPCSTSSDTRSRP